MKMNKKQSWYSIKAVADSDTPSADVHIFDYIGYWDISARSFISELRGLDVEKINLHINSPGGEVFDGIAIQNSLKSHKAEVVVYIDGLAASIASIIALAGDQIEIADNAYVMIHNPSAVVWGEAKDMLKEAELLAKISDGLAGDYSRKMGITVDEARAMMDEETWFLGQEAVDAGFADAVFSGTSATAHFDIKRVSAKAPKEVVNRFCLPVPPKNKTEKKEAYTMADEKEKLESVETEATEQEASQETGIAAVEEVAAVDMSVEIKKALKADRKRQAEIRELGAKFGFTIAAEKFAGDDSTVEEFRAHILNKSPEDWRESLAIKNPAVQESEEELNNSGESDAAIEKIKARRKAKFSA